MTPQLRRPRILIVEDFVLIQESIRLVLQPECDVVSTAEDGEAAVALAAEFRPDVVTLDVSLPGMNGFKLAERMQRMLPSAAIIFVTAHGDASYIQNAFQTGAKAYVLKGTMQSELPTAIREAVAGRRYLSPLLQAKVNLELDQADSRSPKRL